MPNHCENDLTIYHYGDGDSARIVADVLATLRSDESDVDFEKILPCPAGLRDQRPDSLSDAEYMWRKENWGTKWNAYDIAIEINSPAEAIVHFSTAWAPPTKVIDALAARFPQVGFCLEYYERGMAFSGGHRYDPDDDVRPRTWHCNDYAGLRGG